MKKMLLAAVAAAGVLCFFLLKAQTGGEAGASASEASRAGKWAAYDSYHVGDSVLYYAGKWKRGGVIKQLGVPYNAAAKNAATSEAKYLVLQGGGLNWPEWMDFSQVAGLQRQDWWTGFFPGEWQLGEVMAVNTRREGSYEQTEYSYHKAMETLKVLPNGSYSWTTGGGETIKGKWIALPDGPGIILQKAYKGFDWTFINQTNAITLHIRKLESGRLFPNGTEMSKAATRKMK